MTRIAFLAAVTLACVLAATLLLEYRGGENDGAALTTNQPAPSRASPPAAIPGQGASRAAADAAAPDLVRTILARPLFSPSRRPGQVAVASTELPRLAGIIIGPHGARAIFASEGDARAIIAGPGAHAGPYLVRAVGAAGVSVVGPDGPQLLHPSYDHNAARDPSGPGQFPGSFPVSPGQPGAPGSSSILDLLRARVQNGDGLKPALLPPPSLPTAPIQTRPGNQR